MFIFMKIYVLLTMCIIQNVYVYGYVDDQVCVGDDVYNSKEVLVDLIANIWIPVNQIS